MFRTSLVPARHGFTRSGNISTAVSCIANPPQKFGILRFNDFYQFSSPASMTEVTLKLELFAVGFAAPSGVRVGHRPLPPACPVRAAGIAVLFEFRPCPGVISEQRVVW